jgi:acetyl esterase
MKKFFKILIIAIISMTIVLIIIDRNTPALKLAIIKPLFDKGGVDANAGLEAYVPKGISMIENISYHDRDEDALLDIFFPESSQLQGEKLPLVIWVHGGGWVAGSKKDVQNYCKIIAHQGYLVVSVEYTLAPKSTYPKPLQQVMNAIQYLNQNQDNYPIDVDRMFLAGDSAGAQIVAQVAAIVSNSTYADQVKVYPTFQREQLSGVILYCGFLKVPEIGGDKFLGWVGEAFLWSYSGTKNYTEDEYFQTVYVLKGLNGDFPPAFISVGNADAIRSHSFEFADKLKELEVPTYTLFYDEGREPPLNHEYQFHWHLGDARLAFDNMMAFLKKYSGIDKSDL